MPSSTPTKLKNLVLATSLISNAVLGGRALYVEGGQRNTGNLETEASIVIAGAGQVVQSGSYVPVRGTLTGSGQKAIQNPTAFKLKCPAPTLYVATAASPTTMVDVKHAAGPGDVGNTIFDNLVLAAGLHTASGSSVSTADGAKYFLLDEAGGTNDYVYFSGVSGSGQSLVAYFNMDCWRITN